MFKWSAVCALLFVFLSLSASSCDSSIGASSYLNSSLSTLQGDTDYRSMAREDAVNSGIDPGKFIAQINMESGFRPDVVSSAGAIGIAQFMPSTAAGLGIDPWNPVQSLQGAARLMASYNRKYGDYKMALAAYQCGSGCLQTAIDDCGYWYRCVPDSTRAYIDVIEG